MIRKYEIKKTNLNERILAVSVINNYIYLGIGNKFINYTKNKVLCNHEKSIRAISGNNEFLGCCSYDGTATVFNTNEDFIDKIEGPDTEIKGIGFHSNFIALTTRGKTTWILEDLEISKILEDHVQDVKGCIFENEKLYTWSYDGTIKIYELFDIDHSWELTQSLDLNDIIWSIHFFNEFLIATVQNGKLFIFAKNNNIWCLYREISVSVTPVYAGCVIDEYFGVVCNRNCIMLLDKNFNNILEVPDINDGFDVFAMSFDKVNNMLICGSEDGTLSTITLA